MAGPLTEMMLLLRHPPALTDLQVGFVAQVGY